MIPQLLSIGVELTSVQEHACSRTIDFRGRLGMGAIYLSLGGFCSADECGCRDQGCRNDRHGHCSCTTNASQLSV